ncbi:MAG: hypothetical protein U0Q18_05695 [Bryobacteraceae bacterium]
MGQNTSDGTAPQAGGVAGSHPDPVPLKFNVAPATADQSNTIHLPLNPVACWRVDDIRFAFDSSFVTADIAAEVKQLHDLREDHAAPGGTGTIFPPLSVWGHADPTGPDDYNKSLSGRRATAIYALLISNSDPDKAVSLWTSVSHTENWGSSQRQAMQDFTGSPAGTPDAQLFKVYMQQICSTTDSSGTSQPLVLTAQDFLGQGADSGGKGDYQGCSSFNPQLVFSQSDQTRFEQAQQRNDQTTLAERNDANAQNRRVVIFLFRPNSVIVPSKWPCPRATEGTSGCIARFFSDGENRRKRRLPDEAREFEKTKDTFACRFYQRVSIHSPCEQKVVPAVLEVVLDNGNAFAVNTASPTTDFVRVGIWDHAFDAATGNLLNNRAEAQNFVGADNKGVNARRFYFRVTDKGAQGMPEVRVNWRTEFGSGGTDDAPGSQVITLTPTSDPTVFVSHAVFLVSDSIDQAQATDSGLPAANADTGARAQGQSNQRTRLITVDDTHKLDSTVVAEYRGALGGPLAKVTVPVFKRSPEERLKINVHLVNVRNLAGGTGALTAARKQTAIDTFRSVYARCGIFLNIDEIVIDPPASCINWQTRYPASPLAIGADPAVESAGFTGGNLIPSTSQADIINLIRGQAGFDSNDIYVVYITRIFNNPVPAPSPTAILAGGPGGISFPDSFTPANSIARSFVFVGVQTVNQFADPHEMTHVTTNLRNSAGGHFHLEASVNAGPGNIDGRNLMQRFVLIANGNVADSKRLWDDDFNNANLTPAKIPAQITAIRASRFVRPF